jgi:hypothetical protein
VTDLMDIADDLRSNTVISSEMPILPCRRTRREYPTSATPGAARFSDPDANTFAIEERTTP